VRLAHSVIFVDTQVCTGSESPSETRHRYEDPRECNPFRQITFDRLRSTASFATCNCALASVLLALMTKLTRKRPKVKSKELRRCIEYVNLALALLSAIFSSDKNLIKSN